MLQREPDPQEPNTQPSAEAVGVTGAGLPLDPRLADLIASLWKQNREKVMDDTRDLEAAVISWLAGPLAPEKRKESERTAHKLAGSLGTYGFPEGSRLAKEIELAFAGDEERGQRDLFQLSSKMLALKEVMERQSSPQAEPVAGSNSSTPATSPPKQAVSEPQGFKKAPPEKSAPAETTQQNLADGLDLMVITSDLTLSDGLTEEAGKRNINITVCADARSAYELLGQRPADLLLIDLGERPALSESESQTLKMLRGSGLETVPLVVSTSDAMMGKVELVRDGAAGLLDRDQAPSELIEAALFFAPQSLTGGCVLAVDDHEITLEAINAILTHAGVEVHTLSDPHRFWDVLSETQPAVLLLDIDIPEINGIEMCQVVRSDSRWDDMAIVFLTGSTDQQTLRSLFTYGADGYLNKPLAAEELTERVISRLKMSQRRKRNRAIQVVESEMPRPEVDTPAPASDASSVPTAVKQVDIAVVDDDPVLAELLVQSLRTRGYHVEWMNDGHAAVEQLTGDPPQLGASLIVLDVDMPGMDGLSVLTRLSREGILDHTKVLMLTARSTETEMLRAFELGAKDHVTKPFSLPVLTERVRRLLGD